MAGPGRRGLAVDADPVDLHLAWQGGGPVREPVQLDCLVHPNRGLVRRVCVGEPLHAVDVAGDPGRGPLDRVIVPLGGIDRLRCLGLEVRAAARVVQDELDP